MEYFKLALGIGVIIIFTWFLLKSRKRSSFIIFVFRIDAVIGIIAGIYTIVTSVQALVF